MNGDRLDPRIADWISDGPTEGPRPGLASALAATREVGQRPGWTFGHWWLPDQLADRQASITGLGGVGILLVLALVLLLALAATLGGGSPRARSVVGPQGDTLVAFQDGVTTYLARADGSGRRAISDGIQYARGPVFSPNGTHLAIVAPSSPDSMGGRLLVVPVDGSAPAIDVSRGIEVRAASVTNVAWSPDATHIAFAADAQGVSTIFVAASDGSYLAAITDRSADRDLPSWSPDAAWVAFRVTESDGLRRSLQMARPDGTDVRDVTMVVAEDGSLSRLRWSPAGDLMSYALNAGFGTDTRAVIDLGATHHVDPWTSGLGGIVDAGIPWSPDGKRLAILTARDGVVVADSDSTTPYDGQVRRLGPVADCWIDWSPDGAALYGGSPDGCGHMVVIPLDDPAATTTLPMSISGPASWQPLP